MGSMEPVYDPALASGLETVRTQLAESARACDRDPDEIRLLPVTKNHPVSRLRALASLGCRQMAENRVQELSSKAAELADLDIQWVLIGHLQTNKARVVAQICSEIQSLDSVKLARTLSRHLQENGRVIDVLLQVNTSGEEAKTGFYPSEAAAAFDEIRQLPGLNVRGLMTMARLSADPEVARASFRQLRELRDSLGSPAELPELSMGMSGDFQTAIEEGATTIRVGTAIFGARA